MKLKLSVTAFAIATTFLATSAQAANQTQEDQAREKIISGKPYITEAGKPYITERPYITEITF